MKIKLVFDDWRDSAGKSVYNNLSTGEFHAGTTFDGKIELDEELEFELRTCLERGHRPVFRVLSGD